MKDMPWPDRAPIMIADNRLVDLLTRIPLHKKVGAHSTGHITLLDEEIGRCQWTDLQGIFEKGPDEFPLRIAVFDREDPDFPFLMLSFLWFLCSQ